MSRRLVLSVTVFMLAIVSISFSMAQAAEYPRRPINIVVPYKAGGGTDAYARALSAAAKGTVNVPMVVVNKGGSGGLNGAQSVMGARPDGYTIMLTSGGSFLLSTLTRNTKIDALDSFEFVAQVGLLNTSLMVPASSPFNSVEDLLAAAKEDPDSLRWAHSGRGGLHHVGGMGFLAANGLEIQDVPYKGGGPTRAALIGNQADFGFLGVQQLQGFEEQLRSLAVNSQERDAIMKDVPSFGELGIAFADVSSPVMIFAPKGVPSEILSTLEAAINEITAKPEFAEQLATRGTGPIFSDSATARELLTKMKQAVEPLVSDLEKK